jgi:hypothetical protein
VQPFEADATRRPPKDWSRRESWPALDEAALAGPLGEVVRTIAPETEADPAAMLADTLCSFGNAVGSGAYVEAAGTTHPPRLNVVIVGATANARKGTAFSEIMRLMRAADPEWAGRVVSGLSSGEGLIKHAASCPTGRGLLVRETEFARPLKAAAREGSILSPVLRSAWDTGELRVMTKEPISASQAHISICADITAEELRMCLGGLTASNGFANRFLFVCARRARSLPHGGRLGKEARERLAVTLRSALETARNIGSMQRSSAGDQRWEDYYGRIGADSPGGLLGRVVSRGEAQLLRLSEIYALADGSATIEPDHLDAAWAFWSYCRASAEHLFGDGLGDQMAEKVRAILRKASGKVLKRSEVYNALGRHVSGQALDRAATVLTRAEIMTVTRQEGPGRWAEVWTLVE